MDGAGLRGTLARFIVTCCLTGTAVGAPAYADTRLFTGEKWTVDGAVDTAPNPRNIAVTVNGQGAGAFSELKLFYDLPGGTFQVFSVKGSGALRPALPPPGQFGATFYVTGYWECDRGFIQNTAITALGIAIDPERPGGLRLAGTASNLASFAADDFTLRLSPPTAISVKVDVSYTLRATAPLCVDQAFQGRHVASESIGMLSVGVPPVDAGSYQWLTGFVSEDLTVLGTVAVTPFEIR